MYKCLNCGKEFKEPKVYYETVPYGSQQVRMPASECCPFCDGDFEEGKKCEHCGNYFIESKDDTNCKDCFDELQIRFSNMLHNNFTKRELRMLNVIYDGKDLK